MKKREYRELLQGRKIRFTNFIDSESLEFEAEAKAFMSNAAIEQTLGSFRNSRRDSFIMQMRGEDGIAAMQACVNVGSPRWFSGFSMATVPKLCRARNSSDQEVGLAALRDFCAKNSRIMTLRLQPERFDWLDLMDFQAHGLRQGYNVTNPLGTVRTRIVDIYASSEELAGKLSKRTRANIFERRRSRVELRPVVEPRFLEPCREAATAARLRTGADRTSYDFERTFALAAAEPDRVRILGLFFKERPEDLMAYIIAFRRGDLLEFSMGGSFPNEELRALPFNYFLIWDVIEWARSQGCTRMDMGGVTDGGPADPLRGITKFKRCFPGQEIETGREMMVVLKPVRLFIYQTLKAATAHV